MNDISALGCESLTGCEPQSGIVAVDNPGTQHTLQLLQQIVAHEIVEHMFERFRQDAAGDIGVDLRLFSYKRERAPWNQPRG